MLPITITNPLISLIFKVAYRLPWVASRSRTVFACCPRCCLILFIRFAFNITLVEQDKILQISRLVFPSCVNLSTSSKMSLGSIGNLPPCPYRQIVPSMLRSSSGYTSENCTASGLCSLTKTSRPARSFRQIKSVIASVIVGNQQSSWMSPCSSILKIIALFLPLERNKNSPQNIRTSHR